MNLRRAGESALIDYIRGRFSSAASSRSGATAARLLTGIGDDCAVIQPRRGYRLEVSTDVMMEGIHFDLSFISPRQLGAKLVTVNVSDVLAMGARPRYLLMTLALPAETSLSFVRQFFDGVDEALKRYGVTLCGGDLSASRGGIALGATVLGEARRSILRSTARAGDEIFVTCSPGESAMGLSLLQRMKAEGRRRPLARELPTRVFQHLVQRHLEPMLQPPSKAVVQRATAMMDLSDGLLIDLWRMCLQSGTGAELYEESIVLCDELRAAAAFLGVDSLLSALHGGEDYGLLFCAPAGALRSSKGYRRIGTMKTDGFFMVAVDGSRRELSPQGYVHFA